MFGEVVKAEVIVNRSFYRKPLGPVARIVTSTREEWWVYVGTDGLPEMSMQGTLSEEAFHEEIKFTLSKANNND